MLEFLVLGEVPGTQKQLSDVTVLSILVGIFVSLLAYALFRAHVSSIAKQKATSTNTESSDLELISL